VPCGSLAPIRGRSEMTPMAVGFQGWHSRGSGTILGCRHSALWYASVFFPRVGAETGEVPRRDI
jgi:hypothetical protein